MRLWLLQCRVRVCYVHSPGQFWVNVIESNNDFITELPKLEQALNAHYDARKKNTSFRYMYEAAVVMYA